MLRHFVTRERLAAVLDHILLGETRILLHNEQGRLMVRQSISRAARWHKLTATR
jgi:hypothetical protein